MDVVGGADGDDRWALVSTMILAYSAAVLQVVSSWSPRLCVASVCECRAVSESVQQQGCEYMPSEPVYYRLVLVVVSLFNEQLCSQRECTMAVGAVASAMDCTIRTQTSAHNTRYLPHIMITSPVYDASIATTRNAAPNSQTGNEMTGAVAIHSCNDDR